MQQVIAMSASVSLEALCMTLARRASALAETSGDVIARSAGRRDEAIQERCTLPWIASPASAFALRASADLKPAVARAASEGGSRGRNDNWNLVHAGELAVVLGRRRHVGRMGRLRGIECAKVLQFSVHADLCAPTPRRAAPVDALVSRGIVARTASVRIVLRRGRPAQIVPAVVINIPIAVIDRRSPPPAGHVEPRQLMFDIGAPIDPDVSGILVSASRGR